MTPLLFAIDHCGKRFSRCIVLTCLILSTIGTSFAADNCGSLDRVARAIRLAQILNPELKRGEFNLQFSSGSGPLSGSMDARSVLISVDKGPSYPGKTINESDPGHQTPQNETANVELPLFLEFGFAESVVGKAGDVVGTKLSCSPLKFMNRVGSKQIHDAAEVINSHPEWTDTQDLEAAKKLGMRFGPDKKTDLLRILPMRALTSIYGPLQITEAHFRIAGPKEPGAYSTDLHWYITAKHSGSSKTLQIIVEPFKGKITSLSDAGGE